MAVEVNYEEHRRTWNGFCKLMSYSTVAVAVIVILMAIFLL